jgi:hypothetical protein
MARDGRRDAGRNHSDGRLRQRPPYGRTKTLDRHENFRSVPANDAGTQEMKYLFGAFAAGVLVLATVTFGALVGYAVVKFEQFAPPRWLDL